MTTRLDTIITSDPVLKESDVDAPVSFPEEETEVVRKTDRAGCCTFRRFPASRRDDCMIVSSVCVGTIVGASVVAVAMPLGAVFGGVSGMWVGFGLSCPPPATIAVGGLVYAVCTEAEHRKTIPRPQRTTVYAPEEVITEQPQSESEPTASESESVTFEPVSFSPEPAPPSPEPEPAKGGWLNLSSWSAPPSEETKSVDESAEHRKTIPRPQRTTVYAPEEVITEQPQSESEPTASESESVTFEPVSFSPEPAPPSPEPEPAKGGWLDLSSWFAPPSEETKPAGLNVKKD
ncbi:MAG: hypothetical protein OXF02_02185 [Simkaniaceae bacterium]|nr:hypothetical protein [Simkaniaceae bacterium]